jgi:hypothetical protein
MGVTIAAGFTGITYPLSTPRVGWRRITGTVAASTQAAGFAAANAGTYRTDSFWRPTALAATWRLDAASAQNVSYCGIAAHDLGSKGCTILVQSSTDDSAWTTRATVAPTDDSAILALFGTVSARYWRINISGSGGNPTVAVIQFGAVTEFPRNAVYAPSIPFQRTRQAGYRINMSEGGQWLGRSRARVALVPAMTVNHLSETWISTEWEPLALHAEQAPFFVADRPGDHPKSCAYAWSGTDLRAERDTPNAAMANSVTLELTGFLE